MPTPKPHTKGKMMTMKIHILSDLHLEMRRGATYQPDDVAKDADVIVLAGDIGKVANGIGWASETFHGKPIVYVPGNHEFYGKDIRETQALMSITARETGVHLLDDGVAVIDGVRFIGSTLWTDFNLYGNPDYAMEQAMTGLNDFRVIHFGRLGHFSPTHALELHRKSLSWLIGKLEESFTGPTVVVSHHLPSQLSVSEKYQGDSLSPCFASNLDYLFGKMDLWIHGHSHDSSDYVVNGTRVICNPFGYHRYEQNPQFKRDLIVEI